MNETTAFCSGHANSCAMVARLHELKNPPDIVIFCDTGLEFNEVYDYLDSFEKKIGIEIIREDASKSRPDFKFENWFNKPWCSGKHKGEIHGMPLQCGSCWHHRNAKDTIYRKHERKSSHTFCGYTRDEKTRRMKPPKGKADDFYKYPLIEWNWSAENSIWYLKNRIGLPHPLYEPEIGFKRLGCSICPYQSGESLEIIYFKYPEIWDYMLELERRSPHGFIDVKTIRGKSFNSLEDVSDYLDREFTRQSKLL
jgi:3'-phosphoadenosine 5'-phosphosulfate sulfotransferase (PAPS reductase)/FAD synthetase